MNNARILHLRSMPYDDYLKTAEWAEKREQALERDGHCCRLCRSSEHLNVHHSTYVRRGDEDLNDLTTLCQSCHEYVTKQMKQRDLMDRTYIPPAKEITKEEQRRRREKYIIGLLLLNPDLNPHLYGILSETDFSEKDLASIYQLLNSADQRSLPFEQSIPPSLMPVVMSSIEVFKMERGKATLSEKIPAKEAVQCATRLNREHLLDENKKLASLIREANQSGDRDEIRRLQLEQMQIIQQIRILNDAMHLHG